MAVCFDCGREFPDGERYCPFCGSPAEVEIPSDRDLRDASPGYSAGGGGRRLIVLLFALILFLGLLLFIVYMERLISVKTAQISASIY
ncbi:MAG: hypothetical protein D6733_02590 [Methanobacteriota archaeon]|nr:MAG: hypothetical protein D6733_02590 [Euryarchaeota archaeon]